MENRVMCLVMGYLVLGFLVAQSSAVDNPGCYGNCVDKCKKSKGLFGLAACGVICIAECAFDSPSLHSVPKNNNYFCKHGCASSLCTSLLDQENPGTNNFQAQIILHLGHNRIKWFCYQPPFFHISWKSFHFGSNNYNHISNVLH